MSRALARAPALVLAAALCAEGPSPVSAQKPATSALTGITCPAKASPYARLELLFGTTRPGGGAVSDAEWQAFLDDEVTRRFPDGLTVLSGYGQYRSSNGTTVKEGAKMLIIWYQPGDDSEARIEAIRQAYRSRFAQESVLRVDGANCITF